MVLGLVVLVVPTVLSEVVLLFLLLKTLDKRWVPSSMSDFGQHGHLEEDLAVAQCSKVGSRDLGC